MSVLPPGPSTPSRPSRLAALRAHPFLAATFFFLASFMTDTHPSPQHATAPDEAAHGIAKGLPDYGDRGFSLFLRRAFIKGAGYTDAALGRPIIGIANPASAYNPCHGNAPQLIEAVKRGVRRAGGLPMDFPTISVHESFSQPTSMYTRNLMSMDTEEMIRAQPMDAVVLIGGCDKTVPAQLMGAASAGIPAIALITGAMLTGAHRSQRVGACTDCRRYWARFRAGEIDAQEIAHINRQLVASVGPPPRGRGPGGARRPPPPRRDGRPYPRGRADRRAGGRDGAQRADDR